MNTNDTIEVVVTIKRSDLRCKPTITIGHLEQYIYDAISSWGGGYDPRENELFGGITPVSVDTDGENWNKKLRNL